MESVTLGADRDHNPCQLSSLQKKQEEAIASSCLILATPLYDRRLKLNGLTDRVHIFCRGEN